MSGIVTSCSLITRQPWGMCPFQRWSNFSHSSAVKSMASWRLASPQALARITPTQVMFCHHSTSLSHHYLPSAKSNGTKKHWACWKKNNLTIQLSGKQNRVWTFASGLRLYMSLHVGLSSFNMCCESINYSLCYSRVNQWKDSQKTQKSTEHPIRFKQESSLSSLTALWSCDKCNPRESFSIAVMRAFTAMKNNVSSHISWYA